VSRAIKIGRVDHAVEVAPIPSSGFPTPVVRPYNSRLAIENAKTAFNLAFRSWSYDLDLLLDTLNDS
jgi:dTDP-4-dehydrorhamnose reductase